MCPHSGHSRLVLRGSTNRTLTPARFALYSINERSCPKDQLESRARWCRLALTRKRMPLKSSRAIARFVRSASSTISLLIMWLVSRANLRSLSESFLRRRFEECVRLFCSRRPARKTVKRVLAEEPIPLRFVRRFPPYHEIPERRDGRAAVVALHADGWSAKAISGYLEVGTSTVYRILRRWAEETGGPGGQAAR